jgi:hypothetical protein
MKTITVTNIKRTYVNWGNHCEQALAYTLTGEIRKHDRVPFYADSDIPEYEMSVKSSAFTLASANVNHGDTFEEKLADFKARVHSKWFAYVTKDLIAYVMDLPTFERFVRTFCALDHESTQNGGGAKIKCRKESKKMLEWLASQA